MVSCRINRPDIITIVAYHSPAYYGWIWLEVVLHYSTRKCLGELLTRARVRAWIVTNPCPIHTGWACPVGKAIIPIITFARI